MIAAIDLVPLGGSGGEVADFTSEADRALKNFPERSGREKRSWPRFGCGQNPSIAMRVAPYPAAATGRYTTRLRPVLEGWLRVTAEDLGVWRYTF